MINAVPIKRKSISALTLLSENKYFIITLFFLILGMLIGAVSINKLGNQFLNFIEGFFKSFIEYRTSAGFFSVFFKAFFSGTLYMFIIAISAFGISGLPIIPTVVFFRGFGTCALAGILYRNYSLTGIAFADLILLPSCLITSFIIVFAAAKSLELSSKFTDILRDVSSRGILVRPMCAGLIKTILWCMIAVIISSVIEAAFSTCFIGYFNFT